MTSVMIPNICGFGGCQCHYCIDDEIYFNNYQSDSDSEYYTDSNYDSDSDCEESQEMKKNNNITRP